jgi:hypothetical protein
MRRATRTACLTVVLVLSASAFALSSHDVYARYIVVGYVRDAEGKPAARTRVHAVTEKGQLTYETETDASGLFMLVASIRKDSGESLILSTGSLQTTIKPRLDARDDQGQHGTRVDIEADRFSERPALFRQTYEEARAKLGQK